MLVIPAIDLRDGRCVRLFQGDYDRETSYSDDPVAVAEHWKATGCEWLHLVDLDGARDGSPAQLNLVARIASLGVPVELGGGLRTIDDLQSAFDAGVSRVVLGTAAIENPELMRDAVERFGAERVVLGVDARDGRVAVRGWTDTTEVLATDVVQRARNAGVIRVIYTDIERDGTLTSPNYWALAQIAELGLHLIASGGVATHDHLQELASIAGVEGAIVGRAIYDRTIQFERAEDWRVAARA